MKNLSHFHKTLPSLVLSRHIYSRYNYEGDDWIRGILMIRFKQSVSNYTFIHATIYKWLLLQFP